MKHVVRWIENFIEDLVIWICVIPLVIVGLAVAAIAAPLELINIARKHMRKRNEQQS